MIWLAYTGYDALILFDAFDRAGDADVVEPGESNLISQSGRRVVRGRVEVPASVVLPGDPHRRHCPHHHRFTITVIVKPVPDG